MSLQHSTDRWGRLPYSAEQTRTYTVGTVGPREAPGVKWAARRFDSGVHASTANEKFLAMRADNVDLRPFQGVPFDPRNTFATPTPPNAPNATNTSLLTSYTSTKPVADPTPSVPQALSLAKMLAQR